MNRCTAWCVVLLLALGPVALSPADEPLDRTALERDGFHPLFNSKDLTGWKVPEGDGGHWRVVDGAIDYDALSESPRNKNLWTEESFGDFDLDLEWRFTKAAGMMPMEIILPDGSSKKDADGNRLYEIKPNADSGVLLRGGPQVNLWCWSVGSGELYGVRTNPNNPPEVRAAAVPKLKADRPIGQWNAMRIALRGDRVSVWLNDKQVIDQARIPGIPATGPIGFQHHGGRMTDRQRESLRRQGATVPEDRAALHPASSLIQFRHVYVKRLPPDRSEGSSGVPFR